MIAPSETTPVPEAACVQKDLPRSSVEPYGRVASASLTGAETSHSVLHTRGAGEPSEFMKFRGAPAGRHAAGSMEAEDPVGGEWRHVRIGQSMMVA